MKVLIDNGHGENTPGKRSPDGRLREWSYTREIADMVVSGLRKLGIDAERIVKEDTDVPLSERCRRADAIYKEAGKKAILVSIHCNAAGNGSSWTVSYTHLDTSFTFNGGSYQYSNVPGTKTLLEGEMNARLRKVVSLENINAFDASGNPVVVKDITISLQTSAVYGMDLVSADVFQYAGAGIEKVATIQEDGRHLTKVFICLDQPNLTLDKTVEMCIRDRVRILPMHRV